MYQSRSINRHRAVTYTAKSLRLSLADNNNQLLLRWLRNVAQCEFFYCRVGIPFFNALFSGVSQNISMNHISRQARLFDPHFYCRQCVSNFNTGDVIGLQAAEFCDIIGPKDIHFVEITKYNSHYAVQAIQGDQLQCQRSKYATLNTMQ